MNSIEIPKKTSKYHVPALEKGLDILEALALATTPQSLTDLAHSLARNKNEIFRMISYLEARGYIVRVEGSDNYSLSLKLYELSHTHSPVERLLKAATGPMDTMARQLGQTCILGVLHQGKVITLAQALSPTRVRLSFDLGMPYSPIHSVSGRLLLAHLPGDELASLLAGEPDYQALSEAEKADFKVKLETIWHQGYSISRGETRMGVDDIGVLVGNPKIGVMAALTVPVFMRTQQLKDFDEILRPLQQCAQTITSATGLTVA